MDHSTQYRSYGWWVEPDHRTGNPTLIVGGRVSAVLVPADWAHDVQHVLTVHLLAGPALVVGDHWLLLTQPDGDRVVPDDLTSAGVTGVRAGRRLALPPPDDTRWVRGPHHAAPPWQAVVSAARRARARPLGLTA
ncbi:hypothetical protein [Saccharopolyspora rosea]|uniref:Uncharacterized protein n=1 Tax=Saccharopolyspora rosea TaxID=524884 RepID=A0ABW3FKV1_9PSEU|nr:hypothetical protein [Saccharopolyspora rosea]